MERRRDGTGLDPAPQPDVEQDRRWLARAGLMSELELVDAVARWAGSPGGAIPDPPRGLIDQLGSFLANEGPDTLCPLSGWRVRGADAASLVAAFELGRRSARERPMLGARIRSAGDVARAAAGELAELHRECVVVLVGDAADRLRATVTVSEGALDRALFPVREILHAVLIHDGRSFAIAHNHPSGDPEPSSVDVQATRAIRDAARVVGLRFLGHVVVVEDGWQEVR